MIRIAPLLAAFALLPPSPSAAAVFRVAPVRSGGSSAPALVPSLAGSAAVSLTLGSQGLVDFDLRGTLPAPVPVPSALPAAAPSSRPPEPAPKSLVERVREFRDSLSERPGSERVRLDGAFDNSGKPKKPAVASGADAVSQGGETLGRYLEVSNDSPERVQGLSRLELMSLWYSAFTHKIAGLDDPAKTAKYDPMGIIGFCFGRAMAVHLLARRMGLAKGSIRKLFVVGDLRSGPDPQWRFHVTTVVKGPGGRWYAVDPIFQGPMAVKTWIATIQKTFDKRKKARFYLTRSDAVLPDVRTTPPTPRDESGERLIELAFDPSAHEGFAPRADLDPNAFAPDAARTDKHLLGAVDGETRFDFTGITINGDRYDFNGYFRDLMRELLDPSSPNRGLEMLAKPRAAFPEPKLSEAGSPPLGLDIGRLSGSRKE